MTLKVNCKTLNGEKQMANQQTTQAALLSHNCLKQQQFLTPIQKQQFRTAIKTYTDGKDLNNKQLTNVLNSAKKVLL